ncbi:ribbon-helix-helix domain-containing protein [Bacillus cereus group sp. BY142LC]|uniref:ribbon-helix-helix domain-containing protein n=1 Tax=Bacillus cereus group sp. BY142LC TaxID=3018083 RepID=UPI0022E7C1FA|nr:ribbon-helix-helix domain-containing protein [Bacillus cereus group sp. BY142LC]MDA1835045.1 ribbon-helix-helix domain-containing protein [Bacillus cereus group sp. BY142LC]
MLVKEVYEKLQSEGLPKVIKELNVSDKGFRAGLKRVGIAYDNSAKEYTITDKKEYDSNSNVSIFRFVSPKGTRKNKTDNKQTPKQVEVKENGSGLTSGKQTDNNFTANEITMIKELLQKSIQAKEHDKSLFELAMHIDRGTEKARKTVFIDVDVADRLEKLSAKTRLDKSVLTQIALDMLFDKYEI